MDDLLERLSVQFHNLEEDVHSFAPIRREVDEVKFQLRTIVDTQEDCKKGIRELRKEMERESKERREGQEARARETRGNRTLLWVAAIGLMGAFLMSLAAVLAAVVG